VGTFHREQPSDQFGLGAFQISLPDAGCVMIATDACDGGSADGLSWSSVLIAGFPTSMPFVIGTRFLIVEDCGFRNSPAARIDLFGASGER